MAPMLVADPVSRRYIPTPESTALGISFAFLESTLTPWNWLFVPIMRRDPRVRLCLWATYGAVRQATWVVTSDLPDVQEWVASTLEMIWRKSLSRLLTCVEYGISGSEAVWKLDRATGLVMVDKVDTFAAADVWPLEADGDLAGIEVRSVAGALSNNQTNQITDRGRYLWLVHQPMPGYKFFGYSQLEGALRPWLEKVGKNGALDVTRMAYLKNAYTGTVIRHPPGTSRDPETQRVLNNHDIASEVAEKIMTGSVVAMENTKHPELADYAWKIEPAQSTGATDGMLQYLEAKDMEISEGMGVPIDIIRVSDAGSGYSSRSISLITFYSFIDEIVQNIITGLVDQILAPGVEFNFGPAAKFKVIPDRLVSGIMKKDEASKDTRPRDEHGRFDQPPDAAIEQPDAAPLNLEALGRATAESVSEATDKPVGLSEGHSPMGA